MNFLVGNLKPRIKGSILPASWKKNHDNLFFFFDKKNYFLSQYDAMEKKVICP